MDYENWTKITKELTIRIMMSDMGETFMIPISKRRRKAEILYAAKKGGSHIIEHNVGRTLTNLEHMGALNEEVLKDIVKES